MSQVFTRLQIFFILYSGCVIAAIQVVAANPQAKHRPGGENSSIRLSSQMYRDPELRLEASTALSGSVWTVFSSLSFAGDFDGVGTYATFEVPSGLAVSGSCLYVSDSSNRDIRKIDLISSVVSHMVGTKNNAVGIQNGIGTFASFTSPASIVVDEKNQVMYAVAYQDSTKGELRQINLATLAVTTVVANTGTLNTQYDDILDLIMVADTNL